MHIHIYIYIYTYIHVCIYVYTYIYIYIYIYIIHIYVYTHIGVYTHTSLSLYIYIYIHVYVCICTCMFHYRCHYRCYNSMLSLCLLYTCITIIMHKHTIITITITDLAPSVAANLGTVICPVCSCSATIGKPSNLVTKRRLSKAECFARNALCYD